MPRPSNGDQPTMPAHPSQSGYLIPAYGAAVPPGAAVAGAPPGPAARAWPTVPELLSALKRRAVLATFLGLLIGVCAAAAAWLAMPAGKHQAQALLQMKPPPRIVGKAADDPQSFEAYKQTQMRLIRSRLLLDRVVANPNVSRQPSVRASEDAARWLEESLRMKWESPELLAVTMTGDDPKELKIILDTLVNEYLKDAESEEGKSRQNLRRVLQERLGAVERDIKTKEENIALRVKMDQGPNPETNLLQLQVQKQRFETASHRFDQASDDRRILNNQLQNAKQKLDQVEQAPVDPLDVERYLSANPVLKSKFEERERRKDALNLLRKRLQPDAPKLAEVADDYKRFEAELAAEVEKLRPDAVADLRAIQKRTLLTEVAHLTEQLKNQELLLRDLDQEKKQILKKISETQEAAHFTQVDQVDLIPLRNQRATIQQQLFDLDTVDKVEPRAQLREGAVVILNQNLRQKIIFSIAAFVAGLMMVLGSVAFLEWRSRRIDSIDQVVNEVGMRVLGTIPAFPSKNALKAADPNQTQHWRFALNESVNSARTMLLHAAKTQSMQVIMVSSATQGEGKTSLASQLASSMASAGLRTLILDCDMRNPSMHTLFDAPLAPGCAEVLLQEVDVSDAVQPTSVPNLWLIPAGQCSARVISALAQGHPLETLFNRLRGQFDFIVVDSTPILPVADALLVGQHVDGVVMSVLQDISQLPKVITASEKLTQLNIPVLGAVVNGIRQDLHTYGYNYVKALPA